MNEEQDRYWFKPRSFGYGATPTNWKGWAVSVAFAILVWMIVFAIHEGALAVVVGVAIVLVASAVLVVLTRLKSSGAWRWRWKA